MTARVTKGLPDPGHDPPGSGHGRAPALPRAIAGRDPRRPAGDVSFVDQKPLALVRPTSRRDSQPASLVPTEVSYVTNYGLFKT